MRHVAIALCCVAGIGPALAEPCPGNPDAIGTSRTVVVDGAKLPLIGTMHYQTSVPLEDHEVLLTFDDGPRPPYTERILEALAAECVKATFFMVGYMVRANPQTVRRVYNAGHSIGSHSQNHPVTFGSLGLAGIQSEGGGGFSTIAAALGGPRPGSTVSRGARHLAVEHRHACLGLERHQPGRDRAPRIGATRREGPRRGAAARSAAGDRARDARPAEGAQGAWLPHRACDSARRAAEVGARAEHAGGPAGCPTGLASNVARGDRCARQSTERRGHQA